MNNSISTSNHRKRKYSDFIASCDTSYITVNDIIRLGHSLMRKARLHPHFFADNSLLKNAQYLVFFALKLPLEYDNPLYTNARLTAQDAEKIIPLFERRIAERIPVEYITEEAFYLDYKFYVNKHVLVPRSIMNTRFNEFLNEVKWQNYKVLDLCTGSGCVGISLALLHTQITVDLVDISPAALEVAAINIERHNLQDRVKYIQSDLFANVQDKYDLIITNPPYVSRSHYKSSPAEFKTEPKIALECDANGLAIIAKILAHAGEYLNPNGKLIAEVGYATAKLVKKKYRHISFTWFSYKKPSAITTFYAKWIEPWIAMHGVFMCEAKDLLSS